MTNSPIPSPSMSAGARVVAPRPRRHVTRWLLLALAFVLLLVVGFLLVRVGLPLYAGYQAATTLRTSAADGLDAADAPQVEQALAQAHAAVDALAAGTAPLTPLIRRLGWVPNYGSTLQAAPELLALAQPYAALANEAAPLLGAALGAGSTLERGAALAAALRDDPERLARMVAAAQAGATAYAHLDPTPLHPALAGRLAAAGPLLLALPKLLPALPGLPTLLGMDAPHTLLVLVQNNNEIRPTGGFITAYGLVTLDQGQITAMDFADSYAVFRKDAIAEYPTAPQPLQKYMTIPYITFRDSNWSPDLQTTTTIARAIYTADTGKTFDDVVTVDLNAAQMLIAALSPIQIEGIDEPVTGDNIIEIMRELWARPPDADVTIDENMYQWWLVRKSFIPKLAQAVLNKVLHGDADPLALGSALLHALDTRAIQLAVNEPAVKAVLAQQGWDGALAPVDGADFLAPVDTNMGYNKVDAVIERGLAYTVTWPTRAGEAPLAETSITYTHTLTTPPNLCEAKPIYGTVYADMIARCYFNYVRLYVPGGSELIEATGVAPDSVTKQRGEQGTQVFAGYLTMRPGETKTVTFRYRLPTALTADGYALRIQRQSGTGPLAVRLDVGGQQDAFTLEAGRVDWSP